MNASFNTNLPYDTENDHLYIPVNSRFDSRPVYVNPKQYDAILKRRMKKIKKNLTGNTTLFKRKIKSERRSLHAKNRKRDTTGKFKSKATKTNESGQNTVLSDNSNHETNKN